MGDSLDSPLSTTEHTGSETPGATPCPESDRRPSTLSTRPAQEFSWSFLAIFLSFLFGTTAAFAIMLATSGLVCSSAGEPRTPPEHIDLAQMEEEHAPCVLTESPPPESSDPSTLAQSTRGDDFAEPRPPTIPSPSLATKPTVKESTYTNDTIASRARARSQSPKAKPNLSLITSFTKQDPDSSRIIRFTGPIDKRCWAPVWPDNLPYPPASYRKAGLTTAKPPADQTVRHTPRSEKAPGPAQRDVHASLARRLPSMCVAWRTEPRRYRVRSVFLCKGSDDAKEDDA